MCDRTMNPNEKPSQKKAAPAQQKSDVPVNNDEAKKAKEFENFIIKYCNVNAKLTMSILKAHGFNTPQDIPAEQRNEIGKEIKSKIQL